MYDEIYQMHCSNDRSVTVPVFAVPHYGGRNSTDVLYWGLKAGNYDLVNNEGQLATDKSLFPFGSVNWQHEDFRLVYYINGTSSFLKYDTDTETLFSFTDDPQEAADILLIFLLTADAMTVRNWGSDCGKHRSKHCFP